MSVHGEGEDWYVFPIRCRNLGRSNPLADRAQGANDLGSGSKSGSAVAQHSCFFHEPKEIPIIHGFPEKPGTEIREGLAQMRALSYLRSREARRSAPDSMPSSPLQ